VPKQTLIPALLDWRGITAAQKRELKEATRRSKRQRYEAESRRFWAAQDKWSHITPGVMMPLIMIPRPRPLSAQQVVTKIIRAEVTRRKTLEPHKSLLEIRADLAEQLKVLPATVRDAYRKK
jgi:hypothetical protein